jgi:hypothetical protein
MFRKAFRIGLGLLSVVACLSLADSARAQAVPHKEKSTGQIISDTGRRQDWVAAGQGTHLGNYTEEGHHNYSADGSLSGAFTMTAADGSTISGTYEGSFAPIGGGFFQFDVAVQWLEGTGRLEGVTGSGTASAILDGATGEIVISAGGLWELP